MRPTVTFTGRIHTAPEVSTFGTGGRLCRFSVATTHYRRDRGSKELITDHDVHVCVTYTAELIAVLQKQAFKGRLVTLSGQLTYRSAIHRQGRDAEVLIDRSAGIEFLDALTVDGEVIERVEVVPGTLATPAMPSSPSVALDKAVPTPAVAPAAPATPIAAAPRVVTTEPERSGDDVDWL